MSFIDIGTDGTAYHVRPAKVIGVRCSPATNTVTVYLSGMQNYQCIPKAMTSPEYVADLLERIDAPA